MMCAYPNCQNSALWVPVVEVPTLRSVGMGQAMVQTTHPTFLLGKEVCQRHRDDYNLSEWIHTGDWAALQDLAHENGFHLPPLGIVTVQFRPIGWTPGRHLELVDRN